MAKLLFNLRGVPDDEAADVRALLDAHGFDYYETPAGSWGISSPGLWLRDESQLREARSVLAQYQQERAATARQEHERLRREGRAPSFVDELRERPLRFVVYAGIAVVVLYFSTRPFLDFGQ